MPIGYLLRQIGLGLLIAACCVVWWGGTALVRSAVWGGIKRQIQALNYPRVDGEILESAVASDGDCHGVRVKYRYRVDGEEYTSSRYNYGIGSSSSTPKKHFERIVEGLPPGGTVAVYYNPDDPADAILAPGISGELVASAILPFPFVAVLCLGRLFLVRNWRFRDTGGVPLRDDGLVARLGTSVSDPVTAAYVAAGFAAFPLVFVVLFLGGRMPLLLAIVICLAVLGMGAYGFVSALRRFRSGEGDVVLDRACGVLTLPVALGRSERLTVPWSSIVEVKVEHCTREGDYQYADRTYPHYAPVVVLSSKSGGAAGEERVIRSLSKSNAQRLADWLRRQLGR